jgi:hypothetical protein
VRNQSFSSVATCGVNYLVIEMKAPELKKKNPGATWTNAGHPWHLPLSGLSCASACSVAPIPNPQQANTNRWMLPCMLQLLSSVSVACSALLPRLRRGWSLSRADKRYLPSLLRDSSLFHSPSTVDSWPGQGRYHMWPRLHSATQPASGGTIKTIIVVFAVTTHKSDLLEKRTKETYFFL